MKKQHQIDIQIEEQAGDVAEAPLRQAVLATLVLQNVEEPCEVVVVIADDTALHDLNRRFRAVDRPTDVLAFTNDTRGPFAGGVAGFPRYLGDVVISVERAQAQAEQAGVALVEELQLLVVHGVLHLLGYDHADQEQKAAMWAAQDAALRQLGVDISLPE